MKMHLAVGVFFFAVISSTFAQNGPPPPCCLSLSSQLHKVSVNNIIDYKWQIKGVCPVTAVIVTTWRGKQLCADPDADWTKRVISRVNKRRSEEEKNRKSAALIPSPPAEGNREEAPAPTAPSAPSAPSDTPLNSQHPESSGPAAAPTDQLKTSSKSVKTVKTAQRKGKGGRKRKIIRKVVKKKAKKTSQ